MRAQHSDIDVDTYHGGLLLFKELSEALGIMTQYDLIVLDEISMLTDEQFEKVLAMWQAADKMPCLLLLGDFWQLPIVDPEKRRCDQSLLWRKNVRVINFREQVRCKDPKLQEKLDILRTAVPSVRQLDKIKKNHCAWTTAKPTDWDILSLLRKHPDTTIVTCTRAASALVNALATQVLFVNRHKQPIGNIPLDYECNESNYTAKGQLKKGPLQAAFFDVFEGQRIFLTRNLDKENGFVNGMSAVIEAYDSHTRCLRVVTKLGTTLAVYPYTEELPDGSRVTSFPVRIGYASTIQKIQGATLRHITIWLNRAGCRAAAYVALSRVEKDEDYLIAGKARQAHFVPAQ
eukprot:Skav236047  [mRNA]  locus=scaffold3600:10170:11207:+ [translate_table: standard]